MKSTFETIWLFFHRPVYNLLPDIPPSICYLWYNHQFVTCDTTTNLLPVIQPSICYLWYNYQFVTCDTTINLLPMIQPSICYLRYNHQFVVVDVYKPKEHRVNNHLYWCHGSHNSHVINHQKSVNCHGVLSEIIQKIKIIMCFTI